MSVLVAQLGARRHYAVPRALQRCGLLDRLVTDICAEQPFWRRLEATVPRSLRPRVLASLLGRRVEGVPLSRIANLPLFALSPTLRRRNGEALTDHWARRNCAFGREVVRRGFGRAQSVYAFNGAALEIFEAAKERGLTTLLDQTAAPWRWNKRMLLEEALRWPGWEDQPAEVDASDALAEREEREWQLADAVICGSTFAAAALAETGGPRERCTVIPYADHAPAGHAHAGARTERSDRFRVLFAGTLQLRKGVQYLMEAARLLKSEHVDIRLVGPSLLNDSAMNQLATVAEVVGPVPRSEIGKHYAWADVLVLPTLSEGSANVVHEAMAAGLAVVTTLNAGSIIRDGHDGLIVPPRDPAAIANLILRLAENPDFRVALGQAARASVAENSFDRYARRLAAVHHGAVHLAQALYA